MALLWTDTRELAIELCEKFPELNPQEVRFTALFEMICNLESFSDDPKRCNERVLEAIVGAWLEEI